MPSPNVLVNNSATTNGIDVSAGSSITITLADATGVSNWTTRCIYTDNFHNATTISAGLTFPTSTSAHFTAPSDDCALIFQSVINNGIDNTGTTNKNFTTTYEIHVLTVDGYRLIAAQERNEADPNFGWISKINRTIRNPFGNNVNLNRVLTNSNNAAGIKITNLGTPTIPSDAATKGYVDSIPPNFNITNILNNGNDAGGLQIKDVGNPTLSQDVATKNYVDGYIHGSATDANYVVSNSGVATWLPKTAVVTTSINLTLGITYNDRTDVFVLCNSSSNTIQVSAPRPFAGRRFTVKDQFGTASTHNITVTPFDIESIDIATISTTRGCIMYQSDGSNWYAISKF